MNAAAKYREAQPLVAKILLRDWDPIGVRDFPEASDEYDAYVPGIFALLSTHPSVEAVAAHLVAIETDRMGMAPASTSSRLPVARLLLGLATEIGVQPGPYPCPACGFLTFTEPPGSYSLCEVCNWEDDAVQLRHPALRGGANHDSLVEAQRRAVSRWPLGLDATTSFRRDPTWRPLSDSEWQAALGTLRPGGRLPALGTAFNDVLYYWSAGHNAG
jgi:hypothetical protein